jgi:hypothetical protein
MFRNLSENSQIGKEGITIYLSSSLPRLKNHTAAFSAEKRSCWDKINYFDN